MAAKGEATRERILEAAEALVYQQGFTGTSLQDILTATGLTKGAFFYHFRGKNDLARAMVERYARNDIAMFAEFSERAARLTGDPLQEALIFLKLFEEFIEGFTGALPGCVFASYTFEQHQFDAEIRKYVRDGFGRWQSFYQEKFAKIIADRPPRIPVTAQDLAEMIICLIEGGILLSRAYDNARIITRQSRQFRDFLRLLFSAEDLSDQPVQEKSGGA